MDEALKKAELRGKDGGVKGNFSGPLMFADEETSKTRLETCQKCENYLLSICKKCGCFMPAKTKLKMTTCPINKW